MDLSQLKSLGEIAGIGGIALGVVVLLLRPLIATIGGLPKGARSGPVKLIAIGGFVIGVLGIATWTISGQLKGPEVSTLGNQSPGVISGGDATINFGSSPAVGETKPCGCKHPRLRSPARPPGGPSWARLMHLDDVAVGIVKEDLLPPLHRPGAVVAKGDALCR